MAETAPKTTAEPILEVRRPFASRLLVEQIDGAAVVSTIRQHEIPTELVEALLGDIGRGDRRTVVDKPPDHRRSKPAGRAGDRDHTAVELAHRRDSD